MPDMHTASQRPSQLHGFYFGYLEYWNENMTRFGQRSATTFERLASQFYGFKFSRGFHRFNSLSRTLRGTGSQGERQREGTGFYFYFLKTTVP